MKQDRTGQLDGTKKPLLKRSRFGRMILAFGGFVILLCCGAVTWFYASQEIALRDFQKRVEELNERGVPTNNASLQRMHLATTSNMATAAWVSLGVSAADGGLIEAFRNLPVVNDDPSFEPMAVPSPGVAWSNRQHVDKLLADWRRESESLEVLAEAQLNATQKLYRPIEFRSIETLLPDTQNSRDLIKLAALKHRVAVFDGDSPAAYRQIRTAQGVVRSFDDEPILISQLVRRSISGVGCGMIRHSLEFDLLS